MISDNVIMSAKGLVLPQSIGGGLDLSSLTSAKGIDLPQSIGGDLYLCDLTGAEGLVLPQSISGSLDLSSLTSAEGLIISNPLTYDIYMNGFIITPENVEEYRNSKNKQSKSC